MDIIVATGNQHKLEELQALLTDVPVRLRSLSDVPDCPPIVEDGATFTANALIKARTVARHTGTVSLADDSGLAVDALGGRPGVHSARFAGPDADDAANNALLLGQLARLPGASRAAQFCCTIAVVAPCGRELVVEGCCPGRIIDTPRGTHGFGYDPLFLYEPAGKTFAELDPAAKNRISHRSRAAAALTQQLPAFLASLPG